MTEASPLGRLDRARERIWWLFVALSAALGAYSAMHPIYDGDAFWHMSLGRETLAQGARSFPERWAFSAFSERAFAPEWLWGVLSYGSYLLAGARGLGLLPMLAAVVSAFVLGWFVRDRAPSASFPARALVFGLAFALALCRMRVRPHLACLLLLPLFLLLAYRYRDSSEPRRQRKLAALLLAIELLWAQLHGSFVLAPMLFLLVQFPRALRSSRAERQPQLLLLLGLIAGLCTSAYGFEIASYVWHHSGGDATAHVLDMMPPRWRTFEPGPFVYGPAFVALCLLGLLGGLFARRLWATELALLLFALLLGSRSIRFLSEASSLLVPWAVAGASALLPRLDREQRAWAPAQRVRWLGGALVALGLTALAVRVERELAQDFGPLGQLGFAQDVVPEASLRVLASLPVGTPVLTSYAAGGVIGFFTNGRVRTYVDGRTPLYFDDTDYGVSRDVLDGPPALSHAIARYGVQAMVLDRRLHACERAPEGFVVAALDTSVTTFVRPGVAQPFTLLAPCGNQLLRDQACRERSTLERELSRLHTLGALELSKLAAAEVSLRCERDGAAALAKLPRGLRGVTWPRVERQLRAAALLSTGARLDAFETLEADLAAGDGPAFDLLTPALLSRELPRERLERVLRAASRNLDDFTPPQVRALLAAVCAERGDAECVRFHGTRAFVAASDNPLAQSAMAWLRRHHPLPRVREDAAAWLRSAPTRPSR